MSRAFESDSLAGAVETMFSEARTVRFQDVDAASIVFFPRVLEYMHDVYVAFLAARGIHLARSIEANQYRIPLVHAEADYRAPMRFGDPITVDIVALKIGRSSFQIGYRIRHEDGRVAAVGQMAHVCVGLPAFAAIPIPDALRAALESKMV
jgi:1,4-dihydroxy-2-naphthoyl-CoA hydrolase